MKTRLQTALKMESIAEPYIKKSRSSSWKGRIVIFGAGTGNPILQDTAAGVE
jgi:uridylate kinase